MLEGVITGSWKGSFTWWRKWEGHSGPGNGMDPKLRDVSAWYALRDGGGGWSSPASGQNERPDEGRGAKAKGKGGQLETGGQVVGHTRELALCSTGLGASGAGWLSVPLLRVCPVPPDVLRAAYPTPVIRAYALFFASWTTSGSGLSEPQFPQLSSGIFHTIVEMTT